MSTSTDSHEAWERTLSEFTSALATFNTLHSVTHFSPDTLLLLSSPWPALHPKWEAKYSVFYDLVLLLKPLTSLWFTAEWLQMLCGKSRNSYVQGQLLWNHPRLITKIQAVVNHGNHRSINDILFGSNIWFYLAFSHVTVSVFIIVHNNAIAGQHLVDSCLVALHQQHHSFPNHCVIHLSANFCIFCPQNASYSLLLTRYLPPWLQLTSTSDV